MKSKLKISKGLLTLCRTGFLCAVALVISVLENLIPVLPFSLPGMKLGLSNIAVIFALELCSLPCALGIVAVKALFALATRGAIAFMMSFFGGILATLGMYFLIRSKKLPFGCLGIGIGGAFLHNTGQFFISYLLFYNAVFVYFPVLCLASLITGTLTALVCYIVMPPIKKIPLMNSY